MNIKAIFKRFTNRLLFGKKSPEEQIREINLFLSRRYGRAGYKTAGPGITGRLPLAPRRKEIHLP